MVYKKTELIKSHILSITQDLLNQHGFDNLRAIDIAKHAKIAKGSIFYHFATMDDLVATILGKETQMVFTELNHAINDLSPDKALEKLFLLLFSLPPTDLPWAKWFSNELPPQFHYIIDQTRKEVLLPVITSLIQQGKNQSLFIIDEVDIIAEIMYVGFDHWLHQNSSQLGSNQKIYQQFLLSAQYLLNNILKPTRITFKLITKEVQ